MVRVSVSWRYQVLSVSKMTLTKMIGSRKEGNVTGVAKWMPNDGSIFNPVMRKSRRRNLVTAKHGVRMPSSTSLLTWKYTCVP